MCHARDDGCCKIVVNTYFDVNVELRHNRTVNRRQTDERTEEWMSQSQEVREMFHTKFDGCLVL